MFYKPKICYLDSRALKFQRGQDLLNKFKSQSLEIIPFDSKQPILTKFRDKTIAKDFLKIKSDVVVLTVGSAYTPKCGERSTDFGCQGTGHGCTMACAYCYTARHTGYANPIQVFANMENILDKIKTHSGLNATSFKTTPTTADSKFWIYDAGCSSDLSVDALISDNVKDYIKLFTTLKYSKLTFSTKYVNMDMLTYDPQHKTRIRFSLMPQTISSIVDLRTSKIVDRINAINDFYNAGYDVDLNFAPIIIYPGWKQDWELLLDQLNDTLSMQVKKQLNLEIIFVTHNEWLHNVNMEWLPNAEKILWQPDIQAKKISRYSRMVNYRYKLPLKKESVSWLKETIAVKLPYVKIRYAF